MVTEMPKTMIEISCKNCGHNGAFIERISYDTFSILECPKCHAGGVFKGKETAVFGVKEVEG